MKIYQVEELVGVTKKNIRFYEDQGLLNPKRNPENDYREYSLADVKQLQKIKLLRKIDVPIEEIRLLQQGKKSFEQTMQTQIEALEKQQKNAQIMANLCHKMKDEITDLNQLDAEPYLEEMGKMETEGAKFVDIEREDIMKKQKSGSTIAAICVCIFVLLSTIPLFKVMKLYPNEKVICIICICVAVAFVSGVVAVLIQRLKEINKGEEYEARKY